MFQLFKRFKRSEKGQGMVEYGLILALVSIVALGSLGGIGGKVNDTFEKVVGVVSGGEVIPEDEEENEEIEKIDGLVAEGYIPIATPEELDNLRTNTTQTFGQGTKWEGEYTSGLDENYILVSYLDLSGIEFEPIGMDGNRFKGTFDGGGYVISNLTIDKGSDSYVGLFGYAEGASFKNIGLEDANVTGNRDVGGLVGYQNSSSISNSYSTGNVTGAVNQSGGTGNQVGGLVGRQRDSSINNSYSTGNVTGGSLVGGLVGSQYDSSTVTSSYATGEVNGAGNNVGGLVGYLDSSSITYSYATSNVTGGNSNVGGLVGDQRDSSTITNSYATGNVTGNSDVGGLVGGQRSSTVTNSYATGNVKGDSYGGGLVGYQHYKSSIISSYYDTETTGQTNSYGGTGKTTDDMKNKDTYVDWDFDSIWTIESGQYPTHR